MAEGEKNPESPFKHTQVVLKHVWFDKGNEPSDSVNSSQGRVQLLFCKRSPDANGELLMSYARRQRAAKLPAVTMAVACISAALLQWFSILVSLLV